MNLGALCAWKTLSNAGTLVEPIYGFVAHEPDPRSLGEDRPLRLFGSEVFFAHIDGDGLVSTAGDYLRFWGRYWARLATKRVALSEDR